MKGYYTNYSYMGYDPEAKEYIPFVTEYEYEEWYRARYY